MREHEIRRGRDIVDQRVRQSARRNDVADQRDNVPIVRIKRRLAVGGAKDLDLRQGIALEALDQDKVDVLEQPQQFGQRRLRRSAQFPHQRDPIGGGDQHFFCARGGCS